MAFKDILKKMTDKADSIADRINLGKCDSCGKTFHSVGEIEKSSLGTKKQIHKTCK